MSDVLVMALVLLLAASGYAAGRVHAEVGYRAGYRLGYRQGHADAARVRPPSTDPASASDSRQSPVGSPATAHMVRHGSG